MPETGRIFVFFNILISIKKKKLPEEYQNNRYCLLEKNAKTF